MIRLGAKKRVDSYESNGSDSLSIRRRVSNTVLVLERTLSRRRAYPRAIRTEEFQEVPDKLARLLLPFLDKVVALFLHAVYKVFGFFLHRPYLLLHPVHLVLQTVLLLLSGWFSATIRTETCIIFVNEMGVNVACLR